MILDLILFLLGFVAGALTVMAWGVILAHRARGRP